MSNPAIDDIHLNWDIDAKKEDMGKYFFQGSDLDQVLMGNRPLVVGRKGTGKTAMFEYIKTLVRHDVFVSATSFSQFPVISLLKFQDVRFDVGSDYISLWTFVILKELCSLVATNERAPSTLRALFPPYSDKKLRRAFVAEDNISIKVLDYFEIKRDNLSQKEGNWIEQIDAMKAALFDCAGESRYYVMFDSLDDNYRGVMQRLSSEGGVDNYFSCISGLIKAVLDLRALFASRNLCFYPMAFLSADVLWLIQDRDKNKWRYSTKYLEWDEDEIKQFLAYRISVSALDGSPYQDRTFNSAWHLVFDRQLLGVEGSRVSVFDYMTTRTLFRPRDYVTYIKDCCEVAFRRNFNIIRPGVVFNTEGWYSEYFWGEFVDEIFPVLPCIDRIFKVIEKIRKPSFAYDDFDNALNKYIDMKFINENEISGFSPYKILAMLYDYSAVGNLYQGRVFKYRRPTSSFDYELPIVVHRGLDVVMGTNPRSSKQREKTIPRQRWMQNPQSTFDFMDVSDLPPVEESEI